MGQMKWIYSLIEDNRVEEFKAKYKECLDNKELGITFDGKFIDIIRVGAIVKEMEKGVKAYNKHLDEMADRHEAEISYRNQQFEKDWHDLQQHLSS